MRKYQRNRAICSRVAELLKEERQQQGFSMTTLAATAGLSQASLSYMERNLRIPNLETLLLITEALQIDPGKLIQRAIKDSERT